MQGIRSNREDLLEEVAWILTRTKNQNVYLGMDKLEELQLVYSKPEPRDYSQDGTTERGVRNAKYLSCFYRSGQKILELGCHDGMVGSAMQKAGGEVVCIDKNPNGFSKESKAKFIEMDVVNLQFPDESFDFVFSLDSFEHFSDPIKVMQECFRVTKPGGYIYHVFQQISGPYGLHAYSSISVPYCQFLFERKTMDDFINKNGLPEIRYDQLNDFTLYDYRRLFSRYNNTLTLRLYKESKDLNYLELIEKYPSCFKGKIGGIDELLVHNIELAFKKSI